ncbi:MAG: PhnE/PtxC family ABC transporter permease [Phycisphaerales bacterium]
MSVASLQRRRPRDHFLRISLLLAVVAMAAAVAWTVFGAGGAGGGGGSRSANFVRFLGELRPGPIQAAEAAAARAAARAEAAGGESAAEGVGSSRGSGGPGGLGGVGGPGGVGGAKATAGGETMSEWAGRLIRRTVPAAALTVGIAVVAIGLAGLAAGPLSVAASRAFGSGRPFGVPRRGGARWTVLRTLVRAGLLLARSVPEYLLAFLALVLMGPGPWAAVIALAIHNVGILGRLMAEVIDDSDPAAASVALAAGAGRWSVGGLVVWPAIFSRGLVFFFYRWETCVRESVVLGMLGFASLGLWVRDARARGFYDELLVYIVAGALIVVAGDAASAWVRRRLARA